MVKSKLKKQILANTTSRRSLLKNAGLLGGALPFFPGLLNQSARAQTATPQRFVQIFLAGGWDSALATDPVVGSKISSGNYEDVYQDYTATTVSGKSNLIIGEGLQPAASAFATMPTAFVNGMFVEVTAHELAVAYMLSGQLTLSRSREYPAFVARMAEASSHFPPHIVLGGPIPLADTKTSAPPLMAQSSDSLSGMLRGPYNEWIRDASINLGHYLIDSLNTIRNDALPSSYTSSLSSWFKAEEGLAQLYQGKYYQQLELSEEVMDRYNINPGAQWGGVPLLASAFLSLKSGLGSYVTVSFQGFDTHSGHLGKHIPSMQEMATALNTFVADLSDTPDPDNSELSLADTTTILITSEFTRTPRFNAAFGTDHWTSASAILMGKGVRDNTVVGATGDDAHALGWEAGSAVTRTTDNALLPDHLAAGILNKLGFTEESDIVSETKIDEIFT